MKLKGRLLNITRDIRSGEYQLSLAVKEIPQGLDKLPEGDLSISLARWSEKRSMSANAYYWVLVSKIAAAMYAPQPFVHNYLLQRYGQLEIYNGKHVTVMIPDTEEAGERVMLSDHYHLKPTSHVKEGKDGTTFRAYLMIRGSSTYDSKEMAALIEGAVSECHEMGIETIPPEELERMLA